MLAGAKFVDPIEWRKLEPDKKFNMMTRMFFWKCSETPMFVNKKLSPDFTRVRTFFKKLEWTAANILYDYMWSIERTPMDMKMLFQSANKWNEQQKFKNAGEKSTLIPVTQYESLLDAFNKL